MRPRRATITAEEREALREQILSHLGSIDDVRIAFEAKDLERARRLGIEFGDGLRLMEDLGWGDPPVEGAIELTLPPEQLRRAFTRLRSEVEGLRRAEEREEAEIENEWRDRRDRAIRITKTCDRILGAERRPGADR